MWSSDLGQVFNPPVEDGLALMADQFLAAGFSDEEVITMAVDEHAALAGEAPSMSRRIQVIGAHSADFVWRAGGAIAVATAAGGVAEVIALSYGERGESGELWKEEGQTSRTSSGCATPRPRPPPRTSARASAASTSATTRCRSTATALLAIADAIREFAPDVLVTHTDTDPFNPDHPVA